MDKRTKLHLPKISDIILTAIGAVLCGVGCGFENFASLGMDAVGSFYDGIRIILGLSLESIGTVSLAVTAVLLIFLLIVDRRYVSIGTVIYMVLYSISANVGTKLLELLVHTEALPLKILIAVTGFAMLSAGLGIYIAVDIGVDAFTGVTLWITDKLHKDLKYVKIACDLILMVAGILLGARIGLFTVVSVLSGGPAIEFCTKKVQRIYIRHMIRKARRTPS